jgi:hypothetical protein
MTSLRKRFTQTDPLQASVSSAYPSAYMYGANNPMIFADPSGLRAVDADSESSIRFGSCGGANRLEVVREVAVVEVNGKRVTPIGKIVSPGSRSHGTLRCVDKAGRKVALVLKTLPI